jgi:hypothetical protein
MSLSAAVGAPAPITIAGKTYTAAPLDLFGLGEVEEWARASILAVATKGLSQFPKEQRNELFKIALERAMALSYDSPEIENYIRTSRGMFTFISVSLAIRHPEMTPQAVATAFTGHTGEVGSAFETIARISGLKQGGADAAEGGKPTGEVVAGA